MLKRERKRIANIFFRYSCQTRNKNIYYNNCLISIKAEDLFKKLTKQIYMKNGKICEKNQRNVKKWVCEKQEKNVKKNGKKINKTNLCEEKCEKNNMKKYKNFKYRNPPGYPDRAKKFFCQILQNPDRKDPISINYKCQSNLQKFILVSNLT